MTEAVLALLTFLLLCAMAFVCMYLHPRLAEIHRNAETVAAVNRIANIFVVMTSLVFGLLITSAKATFEAVDRNIHSYATELVLLDRMLRNYGTEADGARTALQNYVEQAIAHPAQTDDIESVQQDATGQALDAVGKKIGDLQPADSFHEHILDATRSKYQDVVRQRWTIVEQSEGAIPNGIILMLVAWLALIFASFGYRAPKNAVVISMIITAALLISASLYLVLDMDIPFKGPIRVSYQPYHRALLEIKAP